MIEKGDLSITKTEYSVFDKDNWVAKWNEEILEENTVKLVRSINERNKQ